MASFSDLLNGDLPSKKNKPLFEGFESDYGYGYNDIDEGEEDEELGLDNYDDEDDSFSLSNELDDEDDDFGDLDDGDLIDLDAELRGDDPEELSPEVHLTPDEEMKADDMMSLAATSVLVNNELNAEEKADFIESPIETQIAINEGFFLESDIDEMSAELNFGFNADDDDDMITEAAPFSRKNIIKFDKNTRIKQLFGLSVTVSAAAHNDPEYKIYKKACRIKKEKFNNLKKKYRGEATRRLKIYLKRLRSSKSKVLSGIGNKFSKGNAKKK